MTDQILTLKDEEEIADLTVRGYGVNEIAKQLHKPRRMILRYLNDTDREIDYGELPGFKYGY